MASPQSLIGKIDLSSSLAANLSTLQVKMKSAPLSIVFHHFRTQQQDSLQQYQRAHPQFPVPACCCCYYAHWALCEETGMRIVSPRVCKFFKCKFLRNTRGSLRTRCGLLDFSVHNVIMYLAINRLSVPGLDI